MSKKKKKAELDWADDSGQGNTAETNEASERVENLASRAAEALGDLLSESEDAPVVVDESEELLAVEVESEEEFEGDFSEDDLSALQAEEEEPTAIVFDEEDSASAQMNLSVEGTELEGFESAAIEEVEQLHEDQIASVVESLLFSTDRPQSVAMLRAAFKGTNVRSHHIRRALDQLQIEYAGARRGVYLEEVAGGYQLRTKVDNMDYLRRTVKARPFRVSGPALEVLAIVAYKQPMTKSQIDEIRGVESGHLLRALMEKSLVHFAGKSELPGKPMFYGTSRRFLEVFGLRNLQELPSLNEIDQLIPEGIGEEEEKETLGDLTGELSKEAGITYSEGEEELLKIATDLEKVATTTEFFEQEKARMKAQRDAERAQDIREAMTVGEEVTDQDRRWLDRYDRDQAAKTALSEVAQVAAAQTELGEAVESSSEVAVQESAPTEDSITADLGAQHHQGPLPETPPEV